MLYMTITDKGYAAVQNIVLTGAAPSVQPLTFKFIEGNDRPFIFSDVTSVSGTVGYSGYVDSSHVLGNDKVVFTCYAPPDSISPVGLEINRIAIYLGADLFAVGSLIPVYKVNESQGLKVQCLVQSRDIGIAVTTNYIGSSCISKTNDYQSLSMPDLENKPVLAVLKGHSSSATEKGPSLVVKSSLVDLSSRWLMVNGTLVYYGTIETLTSSTFKTPDFSPVGYDLAYAQVSQGTGVGQHRSVTYNALTKTYTVTPAFTTTPDLSSFIELWAGTGSCAGYSNLDCSRSPKFGVEAATQGTVADPDQLCLPSEKEQSLIDLEADLVTELGTLTSSTGSGSDSKPTIVKPAIQPNPKLAVQFSRFPILSPFADNDEDPLLSTQALQRRLTSKFGSFGTTLYDSMFSDRQLSNVTSLAWTPAFRDSEQAYGSKSVPPVIDLIEQDGAIVSSKFSDRLSIGSYSDIEISCPGAIGVLNILNDRVKALNSVLVPKGLRLLIYEHKDFSGKLILDVTGPIYIFSDDYADQLSNNRLSSSATGINTKLFDWSRYTKVVKKPDDTKRWMLDDELWLGTIGKNIPPQVRFLSTDRLLKEDGTDQATSILSIPQMRAWRGSCRVISV